LRLDRYVTHAVVLLVAALVSSYSFSLQLRAPAVALNAEAANVQASSDDLGMGRESTIIKPVYIPMAPLPSRVPILYTVKAGDTLETIADALKIPFREITWSNPGLKLPLKTGQVLRIAPVPGFVVVVKKGDTLATLADRFGIDPVTIVDFNRVQGPLVPGTMLVIPVDREVGPNLKTGVLADPLYPEHLLCPIPGAPIIQKFGPTSFALEPPYGGYLHFHSGVDLIATYGTQIYAAAGGTVTALGYADYFGLRVEITDSYGLVEIYAHMEAIAANLSVGQPIQQGGKVGLVGSTGVSIGSHLHLQLEVGGVPTDPTPLIGCPG
jgi:LysM repeat protein